MASTSRKSTFATLVSQQGLSLAVGASGRGVIMIAGQPIKSRLKAYLLYPLSFMNQCPVKLGSKLRDRVKVLKTIHSAAKDIDRTTTVSRTQSQL
ncbi:hypothetical protein ILYODFUR_005028 [Ilyodon furcidens]|uniref:Uncharacterized protein n=1 Tax=Ilyodon furcidens TaxID=33524 RepID=A0ABV0SU98_9TELE